MIITLKDTTSSKVASRLVGLREDRGASALGRVLTLLVVVPDLIDVDRAIEISDAASREHPCRVIVVVDPGASDGPARLNAQIRVGDTAGPSDVVVLEPRGCAASALDTLVMPLLLSDTPVVAYWPVTPPQNPGAHPLGRIAVRRITDSRETADPLAALLALSKAYTPGDTDLGWSGVTLWRALLAALAQDFSELPLRAIIRGHATHPSSFLVAAWIRHQFGIEVQRVVDPQALTITGVEFGFADGSRTSLERSARSSVAHLHRAGFDSSEVNLPRRSVQDCLMEELRRLDPDDYYGLLLTSELPVLPEAAALLGDA